FKQCSQLLKEDGLALIQAITISDRLYSRARYEVDFIKKYIFPGSCIPSIGAICEAVAKDSDFDVVDMDDIGFHYALTLRDWRQRFQARRGAVLDLGFDERFLRMWEYYLTYCEAGFRERQIRDFQILFAKPFNRRAPLHWDAVTAATLVEPKC
ncbi:MAG: class I SAM-dependent methyltransferase, partial [Planctomycetota bacterium]